MAYSPVPKRVRAAVFLRDSHRCQYCGTTDNVVTVDHLVPLRLGGESTMENLLASCFSCNASKRDRSIETFRLQVRLKQSKYRGVVSAPLFLRLCKLGIQFDLLPTVKFYFERGTK